MAELTVDYEVLALNDAGDVHVRWSSGGRAIEIWHPGPFDAAGNRLAGAARQAWLDRAARVAVRKYLETQDVDGHREALVGATGQLTITWPPAGP